MPEASFSKDLNLPKGNSLYVKLASKGDKIKFRIAATPFYVTRHWNADNKTTIMCEKYNTDSPDKTCERCAKYDELMAKDKEEEAKPYRAITTFRYPILNYEGDIPAIFEFTAKSIHYTIKGYADEGLNVFACDWSVERTEEKPKYYNILRLNEGELTEKQQEALDKAKTFKLTDRQSSSVVSGEVDPKVKAFDEEKGKEDIEPEDLPF